jgi:apolipoprotein N-acyltransferase
MTQFKWLLNLQFWPQFWLAALSGCVMSCAVEPLGWWWLAWLALVPLWRIAIAPYPRQLKLWCAIAWGLAYHGITIGWITGLHPLMWMGIPFWGSIAITTFAWTAITVWGTAFVWLWVWVMDWLKGSAGLRVLVGTALWCGLESVRQISPLDWTTLALTQSPHNLLILHLGQLAGTAAVTAAIVSVNGLIAEVWIIRRRLVLPVALFLALHVAGAILYLKPLSDAAPLTVGILQGNVPTRIKLFSEGLQRSLQNYATGYRALVDRKVDVVLTPEGSLPFLWEDPNRSATDLYQAVLEKKVPLWLGTFQREGKRYTQSLLAISGDGQTRSRYNKAKLVPLGEYTPFEEFFSRLSPIARSMLPGDSSQRFDSLFGRAAVGICYESAFPELFRTQVADGAEFLITASNLDPYSTVLMAQHQAHDLMRAIESDRWVVRVTNTGYSGIINPHGQVLWRSSSNQLELHSGTIQRRQTQTLYVRWGNWLTPGLLGVSVIAWIVQLRQAGVRL